MQQLGEWYQPVSSSSYRLGAAFRAYKPGKSAWKDVSKLLTIQCHLNSSKVTELDHAHCSVSWGGIRSSAILRQI